MHGDLPPTIPVVKLYHHRRTADEPKTKFVEGDPIAYGQYVREEPESRDVSREKIDRKEGLRDPNLIDADEKFIKEIEEYINDLVCGVNQPGLKIGP